MGKKISLTTGLMLKYLKTLDAPCYRFAIRADRFAIQADRSLSEQPVYACRGKRNYKLLLQTTFGYKKGNFFET